MNICPEEWNDTPKLYTNNDVKNKIMNEIQPRDFNVIDHKNNFKISSIIIRKTGYILKFYYIRCIVTKDKIFIFNADSNNTKKFIKFFKTNFNNNDLLSCGLPPELKFLELILIYVCNQTDITINQLTEMVHNISLDHVKSSNLSNILNLQNRLIYAEQEYSEIKSVLSDLMSSKEDMFDLYLSKKTCDFKDELDQDDKYKLDEFEILLENYQNQIVEDLKHIHNLIQEDDIILRLTEIDLADFRNRIALYNTKLSTYSICVSSASMIAALYGMNLDNYLEDLEGGFYLISSIIIFISCLIYCLVFTKLKQIIKKIL